MRQESFQAWGEFHHIKGFTWKLDSTGDTMDTKADRFVFFIYGHGFLSLSQLTFMCRDPHKDKKQKEVNKSASQSRAPPDWFI